MANTRQSEKRARQGRARRLRGQAVRSRCRTMIKKARAAAGGKESRAAFTAMQSVLDRAAGKKLMSANTVSRIKRRISKFLRDSAKQPEPDAKPAA
ncbi:MAG: 30S ribosomal protein S20 [Betaproteobacteria bacterium]|nr:30S ribosomal protein S20 [Betaproteobacteria bacterium]